MTSETAAPARSAPDRLFSGVCAALLGCGLLLAIGSHAVFYQAIRDQGRAAEQARLDQDAAELARSL